MKRRMTTLFPLAAMATLTLLAATVPVAHAEDSTDTCSVSTLKGAYSVQGQGTIVAQLPNFPAPPFPFAEAGIDYLDGAGNLTGKVTLNIDGLAVQATVAGTYKVSSDCTGTLSLTTNLGIPVNESIVVRSNESFLAVDTDSYVVVTRTMEKIRD
jgi:hypothetical protein